MQARRPEVVVVYGNAVERSMMDDWSNPGGKNLIANYEAKPTRAIASCRTSRDTQILTAYRIILGKYCGQFSDSSTRGVAFGDASSCQLDDKIMLRKLSPNAAKPRRTYFHTSFSTQAHVHIRTDLLQQHIVRSLRICALQHHLPHPQYRRAPAVTNFQS